MPLPDVILDAVPPDHLPWVLVTGDTGILDLIPEDAVDMTGQLLELVAVDGDGDAILAGQASVAWISAAAGSVRATVTAAGTSILGGLVSQVAPEMAAGWYRIAVTDSPATQRRTLAHGPLIVRYSPEAP